MKLKSSLALLALSLITMGATAQEGIKYVDEYIRRKEGKAAKGAKK